MPIQATSTASDRASVELAFPEAPRVIYSKNPLWEVICQLRFPAILKIDSEIPASFQEKVRDSFPLSEEEEIVLPVDVPPELVQLFKANRPTQLSRRTWRFISEDNNWIISLARDSATLSTHKYLRWEEFREKLALMCNALVAEYRPSFITRAGLRYRDLIIRSRLGLEDVPWAELLEKHIAGELSAQPLGEAIKEANHAVLAEFPEEKLKLGLRHGTGRHEGQDETGYVIDSDFFSEAKTEVTHVLEQLNFFNRMAGRLFRWCITERLHAAMEPQPVD